MSAPENALGNVEEVSAYLRVPVTTLHAWRHRGVGPRASRVGRHLRYRWSDVDSWLDEQAQLPGPDRAAQ